MADSATQELCGCLRRITALLEKGQTEEAAVIVGEMNGLFPRLPAAVPEDELTEAKALLAHCVELERGLRQDALVALQRLGASRRALVYRR